MSVSAYSVACSLLGMKVCIHGRCQNKDVLFSCTVKFTCRTGFSYGWELSKREGEALLAVK